MTTVQAMDLIVKVTGEFHGNRQDHAMITQALEVINAELNKPEEIST